MYPVSSCLIDMTSWALEDLFHDPFLGSNPHKLPSARSSFAHRVLCAVSFLPCESGSKWISASDKAHRHQPCRSASTDGNHAMNHQRLKLICTRKKEKKGQLSFSTQASNGGGDAVVLKGLEGLHAPPRHSHEGFQAWLFMSSLPAFRSILTSDVTTLCHRGILILIDLIASPQVL